ncbi:hypothetical protein [Pseudomonas sp.]|uniref:hypothetical protein n=1 Tax=Pseudomonas sp. TaxID=306 RepID=UPI0028AB0F8E|nr:hypothetical protein [Pseudomonas sp.]
MTDPLDKATAAAPPVVGTGCARRYAPDFLHAALGTEFPGAQALWARYLAADADSIVSAPRSVGDRDVAGS